MSKTLSNGRSKKGEPFVLLPKNLLTSAAWLDLSPGAKCIFIELKRIFNGVNNGEVSLSCRQAETVAKCSKNTASKKFKELESHGFIIANRKGLFTIRQATTWILTTERYKGNPNTDNWKNWTPQNPFEVSVM